MSGPRAGGAWLVLWSALAIGALCAAILAVAGAGEPGVRVVVRATARTTLALFALAFTAKALHRLWPAPATAWLLRNRRYVGVSAAVSMLVHGMALVALANLPGTTFVPELRGLVFGGVAFAAFAAMAATSTDAAQQRLGRERWRKLHRIGGWYVWFIFTATIAPRVAQQPAYAVPLAVCLAIPALRVASSRKERARRALPA